MNESNHNIVAVRHLIQTFNRDQLNEVRAIDDVSFDILKGETLGLVGESGSGKTTIGRAISRLYTPTDGKIIYKGKDISNLQDRKDLLSFRKDVQMIFQDPYASLNPRMKVMDIIAEGIDIHKLAKNKKEKEACV